MRGKSSIEEGNAYRGFYSASANKKMTKGPNTSIKIRKVI